MFYGVFILWGIHLLNYYNTIYLTGKRLNEPPTLQQILEHRGMTVAELQKPCPRDIQARVAPRLKDWYQLGQWLMLDNHRLKEGLRNGRYLARPGEFVLDEWSNRFGDKASYIHLMNALVNCRQRELVESMIEWIKEKRISTRPGTLK